MNAEEKKRIMAQEKARELRYKRPISRKLNIYRMRDTLMDIQEACDDVRHYVDEGDETLIDALDGDEEEAFEFKVAFSLLSAECEQFCDDFQEDFVPEYFDLFFAMADKGGRMLGYDEYEGDYYGLGDFMGRLANEEAASKMKRLTKDQLITAVQYCFGVYQAYISLTYRYDCIKASMDILRGENSEHLKMVRQYEELYERANEETDGFRYDFKGDSCREMEKLAQALPQEAWIQ